MRGWYRASPLPPAARRGEMPHTLPFSPRRQAGGDAEGRGGLRARYEGRAPLCHYVTSPPWRGERGERPPHPLPLSPRRKAGGDAVRQRGAPCAVRGECPPLSQRDISPRLRGGRGENARRTHFPSPPAVRRGEMPSGRGGLRARYEGSAPLCHYVTSPPALAGGEGEGEMAHPHPFSPRRQAGGDAVRQRGAPCALRGECPPLSQRDIYPRASGGRGDWAG